MSNLKYRLALIVALVLLSVYALYPRDVKTRQRRADGTFYDTTTRRVPLRKGLDLSGGMHLALDVDESKGTVANKSEAIDRALKVVRTRIEGLGVSETVIQKAGNDRILVDIPGIDDRERAIKIAQDQAFLEFQITDKTKGLEKALPRLDAIAKERGYGQVAATGSRAAAPSTGLSGLLTGADTSKAGAKGDSTKSDSAAIPGVTGGAISKRILAGQMPGQFLYDIADQEMLKRFFADSAVLAALPPGKVVKFGSDSTLIQNKTYRFVYLLDARPIITGEYLTDAKPNSSPLEGTVVEFQLNNEGGRRFQRETGKHVGDNMAIVLDDIVMGFPPVINSAIGTRGQITMGQGRDLQNAQDLSLVLKAGALPVPLKVAEVRNIGPSLGRDSINNAFTAGAIAILLIVIIMLVFYRFSGLLAIAGLALYVLYTLATLAGFDAVLTLPGLAGFVLSIGIAVDANVLIFERIREELDRGKTVRTAIDEGFYHARSAIIDSNVTTILTAAVLYQYGSGPVKGFAVTLIAGIVASMITSMFVVRTFFLLWLNRSRGTQSLSI
ncbi:MAG TPA: protein translocase subunit SecD [Gemmatimonadaceae bacterium]|nr:protein translocase subunit SecD [Gemmatimonadaceae bacterium]